MAFTLVFDGEIQTVKGNPFHIETPFGKCYAISIGDALKERDELEEELEKLKKRIVD